MKAVKDLGCNLFDPRRGGTCAVFDARPLSDDIKKYCAQDVQFMPQLWIAYKAKLSNPWLEEIDKEMAARISLSQSKSYAGKGRHMAFGPTHWTATCGDNPDSFTREGVEPGAARRYIDFIPRWLAQRRNRAAGNLDLTVEDALFSEFNSF